MGPIEVTVTMEVTEVDDEEIAIALTIERDGEEMEGPEMRRPREKYLDIPEGIEVEVSEEEVEIDGKTLKCFVLTREGPRGGEIKQWMCKDVPVLGIVKITRNGKVFQELLAWGTEEDDS